MVNRIGFGEGAVGATTVGGSALPIFQQDEMPQIPAEVISPQAASTLPAASPLGVVNTSDSFTTSATSSLANDGGAGGYYDYAATSSSPQNNLGNSNGFTNPPATGDLNSPSWQMDTTAPDVQETTWNTTQGNGIPSVGLNNGMGGANSGNGVTTTSINYLA